MLNKKYLVANGCSFTEGHTLGNEGAWPKFLGEKLNLEVHNIGRGGSGNDTITWRTIEFCQIKEDIAKDSFFVIQLTECLRYHIYYDDMQNYPTEWHVTPLCFQKGMDVYKEGNSAAQWMYRNREELIYIYNNITFSLYKTLQNIVTLTSFFESKGYPYIIFDGINDHKPYKHTDGKFYLKESTHDNFNPAFEIITNYENDFYRYFLKREQGYVIKEEFINNVFNNPYIFKDIPVMLRYLLDKGYTEFNDNEYYLKGNSGHPNLKACDIWTDILKDYIEKTFGKTE
jgi:hypothetical protein